jgi:hypothetical protein
MFATTERRFLEFASKFVDTGVAGKATGQQVEGRTGGLTAPVNGEYGSLSCELSIAFGPKTSPFVTACPELWENGIDGLANKALPGARSIMDDI